MPTKKQIDDLKKVNKQLVNASTDLLTKTVGASGFSGFLVRLGVKWANHKSVLALNKKLTSYMIEKGLNDESVKKAKTTKDLIKKLKDTQW